MGWLRSAPIVNEDASITWPAGDPAQCMPFRHSQAKTFLRDLSRCVDGSSEAVQKCLERWPLGLSDVSTVAGFAGFAKEITNLRDALVWSRDKTRRSDEHPLPPWAPDEGRDHQVAMMLGALSQKGISVQKFISTGLVVSNDIGDLAIRPHLFFQGFGGLALLALCLAATDPASLRICKSCGAPFNPSKETRRYCVDHANKPAIRNQVSYAKNGRADRRK
jgi:hypothetical protein